MDCDEEIPYLENLITSDAELDAKRALREDGWKYLAIYGYTFVLPGLPQTEYDRAMESGRYVAIEGSGDNLCWWDGAPLDLQERVYEYAEVYNRTLLVGAGGS
ncbi:MAG: hypothetical protein DHS20C11_28500 [Lysobacteraceae bacterium]|nr:MAG: hypothetical protein DHS20C11_28500 [Xanthomonadaceae bacterium]